MRRWTATLDILGALLVLYGVSLIYIPAVFILGGIGFLFASYRWSGEQ